ncbi:protoporphyrinogen oxidase [Pontibacter anaerobius]|uniref:Coproporphyrinogen III oxidase n=1 Tax=Pontibacter anaerobius TaxID=2993940 RepID=A0ABT3RK48_9BACT|nr:protoporphyrinogen oxidase [Pontibacter anaerobius]MCX2742175.1 protoporphyrinogen oxidase [Pontibacter anaerobius]
MRVAIIGAGISGLALAYYLQKLGIPYDLFESGSQVGGNIRSVQEGDYLLELGPNATQFSQELDELVRELKLEQELLPATGNSLNHFVLRDGSYQQLPLTPFSLLSSKCFSWKTRYRILQEKNVPPAGHDYETVSQFFERRFGPGVLQYAVNPFIAGLYAGDPDKLLIRKTFPRLKELEMEHGSVLKGLALHSRTHDRQQPISFINGMQTLPNAIADKLISLHTEHRVVMVTRSQGKYIVSCSTPTDTDAEEYDMLVLALPAYKAADLLHYTFPGMAAALQNIHYPPLSVVHTAYNRRDVNNPLDGFGAMHPKAEDAFTARSIWSSSVFGGRCRPHEVLFTTFVGGAQSEHHALTDREQLLQQVHEELKELHGISADKPNFQYAHLWKHSMPQYDIHIEDAHEMALNLETEGMHIAANWHAGVSVPSCIRHAKELACKINSERAHAKNS